MGAQALSTIGEGLDPVALDDIANREAVLDELQRVLNHSTFKDTKRLKRFLKYVVMETLDGRGARLKGYSLGIEVFDRADDFDPQGDTIVPRGFYYQKGVMSPCLSSAAKSQKMKRQRARNYH